MDAQEDRDRFAAWFVERRKRARLRQRDIAERAQASRATISAIENGKAESVSVQMVKRLGTAVGGTETEALIAAGFIALEGLDLEALEWARTMHGLPDDLRQMMVAMLREAKRIAGKRGG